MIYKEFEHLKQIEDQANPFCNLYELENGARFYIEPVFYTHLKGFQERVTEKEYQSIIERILAVARKNKKVVFVGTFEFPQTVPNDEEYIYLEITDITDPLQIYVEDKSRGSDYGD